MVFRKVNSLNCYGIDIEAEAVGLQDQVTSL